MQPATLGILRCPYCGAPPRLQEDACLERDGDEIRAGILQCSCSAYPVVDGIPVLIPSDWVVEALQAGGTEGALVALMGLDDDQLTELRRRSADPESFTYRDAVELAYAVPEGRYFLYRFSDPTFLCTQAVMRSLTQDTRCISGRVLDLCGGSGHLARVLHDLSGQPPVVLADNQFVKLWLARHWVAPDCEAIMLDCDSPLPFAGNTFSLAVCSDAFHYVWQKVMLAREMARVTGPRGTVALPHVHNRQCENLSPGIPLNPSDCPGLFEEMDTEVFCESEVFLNVLEGTALDLTYGESEEVLASEAALIVLATRLPGLFHPRAPLPAAEPGTSLSLNPLYQPAPTGPPDTWRLQFPDEKYALEFGHCRRYLPEEISVSPDQLRRAATGDIDAALVELAKRRVLLPLPPRYH